MSLSRQMILLVTLLVVLLFAGTFFISVYNTRDYLEAQLASHAQDAATSLGLSASQHVGEDDRAMVTAMVNAMIHRGDYRSIRMLDTQGEPWVERRSEAGVDGVPAWFVRAFPLQPPEGSATMMSGWRQVGKVLVVSHPGLAYRKLWDTSRETLNWFLAGALIVLLVGLVLLRILLRPLKEVERQAEAICNRDFPIVGNRPFTLEFRRVVEAMNRLSGKVQQMLSESERLADRLREQAYQDPVTGLANRRQFMEVLGHRAEDPEGLLNGALALLQLKNFKSYNQTHGYPAGDALLQATAALLRAETADLRGVTLAHLAGADFAVLVDQASPQDVRQWSGRVADALAGLCGQLDLPGSDLGHLGVVMCGPRNVEDLLSRADLALRQAQAAGANTWHLDDEDVGPQGTRTASEWRALILDAMQNRHFTLLRQPVKACRDSSLLHQEIFLRLLDPDEPDAAIPAAVFMPMAESTGLAPVVDRAVIGRVLEDLVESGSEVRQAVNMSAASLLDDTLLEWLEQRFVLDRTLAGRLILEWSEYGANAHVERLKTWISRLSPYGVQFALDHFGKGFSSFAYLRAVKAHYLKVDGSFIRSLVDDESNQFFVQAVAEIAHGLDMLVVAESVETQEAWNLLPGLNLDAGRGYWLGRPG